MPYLSPSTPQHDKHRENEKTPGACPSFSTSLGRFGLGLLMGAPLVAAKCPVCGKAHTRTDQEIQSGRKRGCSRSCSAMIGARGRVRRKVVNCAKCGKSFEKQLSAISKKNFCPKCSRNPVILHPVGYTCGLWTVISSKARTRSGGPYFQKCRCKCGTERWVRKDCLNPKAKNASLSCAKCAFLVRRKTLPKNLIEARLAAGDKTFTEIARNVASTDYVVRESIERHGVDLPADFGPPRISIELGQKFGKWTVVGEPTYRTTAGGSRQTYVQCRCECGKEQDQRVAHLITSATSQCRTCMGLEKRAQNSPHWKGNALISGALVNSFRTGARERGIGWSVTADDLARQFEKQDGKCALSGVALSLPSRDYERTDGCGIHYRGNASLDRIDSSKGYTLSNIQWLDKAVNLMKKDLPEEEFVALCHLVAARKTPPKESAAEFRERLLSGLWSKRKGEGAYSPHWKGCGAVSGTVFLLARVNAEARGIPFRMRCCQLWRKFVQQRGRCAMTGIPLVLKTKNEDTHWNASLDRIDSEGPYEIGNVWWVDQRVNLMKRELPLQMVRKMCRLVARCNPEVTRRESSHAKSG